MSRVLFKGCLATFSMFVLMSTTYAQQQKFSQMQFLGGFDAGQQGVNIYKMYDASDNVICYMLMPEVVGRRNADDSGTKWIYDGNTIGSISCVKTRIHINVGMPDDITNAQPKMNQKQKK